MTLEIKEINLKPDKQTQTAAGGNGIGSCRSNGGIWTGNCWVGAVTEGLVLERSRTAATGGDTAAA